MKYVRCAASALIIRSLPDSDPGTDTGKRFIHEQRATSHGLSFDEKWLYVDAPAGRGWVSRAYTEEAATAVLPSPAWPPVPSGLAALQSLYGAPGKPICQAGRVTLLDTLPLSWALEQKIKVFACHKLIEDVLESVFTEIYHRGHWELLEDFGGCYEYRQVKAAQRLSTHAWGIAVDINTKTNALGAAPKMDPRIVAIFADHGFVWGGRWSRPDGMHFQRANAY